MSEEVQAPEEIDAPLPPPAVYQFKEATLDAVAEFVALLEQANQPVTLAAIRGFVVLTEGLPPHPKMMPAFEAALAELVED